MNIKIILNQPYPHGMACTNRIHYYAKALKELNHQVEIIIPIPLEQPKEAKNHEAAGQYEGVRFRYATDSPYRSTSFLQRRIEDAVGPLRVAHRLLSSKQKPDVILLVSNSVFHTIVFKVVSTILRAAYLLEKSELPFAFSKQKKVLSGLYRRIHNRLIYRRFDGIIVISEQLLAFFAPLVKTSASLLLVPVIVNLKEFDAFEEDVSAEKYIAYAGNLSNHKDGIVTLIEAFSQITLQGIDVKLYLIGKPTASAKELVDALIKKHQLQAKVVQTGYVSRGDLLTYLKGARVLALAKPDSTQGNFCFPSKLGEYLATAKPVVTTRVGEIASYLEHGKTAYLADPDDSKAFADTLSQALSRPEEAEKVGKAGKELANEKFNYQTQGKRIATYMQSLIERNK